MLDHNDPFIPFAETTPEYWEYSNEGGFFVEDDDTPTLAELLESESEKVDLTLLASLYKSTHAIYELLTKDKITKNMYDLLVALISRSKKSLEKKRVIVSALRKEALLSVKQLDVIEEHLDLLKKSLDNSEELLQNSVVDDTIEEKVEKKKEQNNMFVYLTAGIIVIIGGIKIYNYINEKYYNDVNIEFDSVL